MSLGTTKSKMPLTRIAPEPPYEFGPSVTGLAHVGFEEKVRGTSVVRPCSRKFISGAPNYFKTVVTVTSPLGKQVAQLETLCI